MTESRTPRATAQELQAACREDWTAADVYTQDVLALLLAAEAMHSALRGLFDWASSPMLADNRAAENAYAEAVSRARAALAQYEGTAT